MHCSCLSVACSTVSSFVVIFIYTSLFHRLGRKKKKYTSKQTTRNREETQKQYLSNSKQVNADGVAHNYIYQIAYMPLLTIGLKC